LKQHSTNAEEGILASVDKQTQSFHKEFNMEIQGAQFGIQVPKMLVEDTRQVFRMILAEIKPRQGLDIAGTKQQQTG
jgi:hypothetical protein